ncbi:MAG: cupin domain-containing protein [Chloroflexi bacterium]|nr:cupin domain-containing protein [Chloroflexota bacterium]
MDIIRAETRTAGPGSPAWFTGVANVEALFAAPEPARVALVRVTFDPGARTAWHTHPLGQTLIITEGCGWVQRWGSPAAAVYPGDVVWFAPGEKHWHGATATGALTHVAIQERQDGQTVEWLEPVSDATYAAVDQA